MWNWNEIRFWRLRFQRPEWLGEFVLCSVELHKWTAIYRIAEHNEIGDVFLMGCCTFCVGCISSTWSTTAVELFQSVFWHLLLTFLDRAGTFYTTFLPPFAASRGMAEALSFSCSWQNKLLVLLYQLAETIHSQINCFHLNLPMLNCAASAQNCSSIKHSSYFHFGSNTSETRSRRDLFKRTPNWNWPCLRNFFSLIITCCCINTPLTSHFGFVTPINSNAKHKINILFKTRPPNHSWEKAPKPPF